MVSFIWLLWPGDSHWVPPFPIPWAGASKSSAITLCKCRSCFSLAGLWHHVMESRFCVSTASWSPDCTLPMESTGWQTETRSRGARVIHFLWQLSFGNRASLSHSSSAPWQRYPLRGEGFWGWGLSLCYGVGLDNIGSNWNRRQISQQRN